MSLQIQRSGADLIVVIPPDIASQEHLQEGDEVAIIKTVDRATFEQALDTVLQEHAATFEYLKVDSPHG